MSTAGYFDANTNTFNPFNFEDVNDNDRYLEEVLGDLTLAVEAGSIDKEKWTQQLFANAEAFESFLSHLQDYNESFRIFDRWWVALERLIENVGDEEGFVTSEEMAELLCNEATAYV